MEFLSKVNGCYRNDVQALRAFSVFLVLIFHAEPSWLPGGFLGVDIFFTISGFVIYRILVNGIYDNSFSFPKFYARRITRLLPAVSVTILLSVVLSVIILPSELVRESVNSAVWSFFSLSNFYFYFDSGYFSSEALDKPLLHLWSLGVEEQFYLFFPLVLFLAFKLKTSFRMVVFFILFLSSLSLSIYQSMYFPEAAFFLPLSRVFQFMLGMIGAHLYFKGNTRNLSFYWLTVVVMITFLAFFYFDETLFLPGWRALILGLLVVSLLVIGGSIPADSWVNRNRLLQYFGNASYSIYLAHWPVAVFLDYRYAGTDSTLLGFSKFFLGLMLGCALYHLVEKKCRGMNLKSVFIYLIAFPFLLTFIAFVFILSVENDDTVVDVEVKSDINSFTIIGDSHARVFSFSDLYIGSKEKILHWYPGCAPLFDVYKIYNVKANIGAVKTEKCIAKKAAWKDELDKAQTSEISLIASRWDFYLGERSDDAPFFRRDILKSMDWVGMTVVEQPWRKGWKDENMKLLTTGLYNLLSSMKSEKIVLVGQVPLQFKKSVKCAKKMLEDTKSININKSCNAISRETFNNSNVTISALLKKVAGSYENVILVEPGDIFCDSDICPIVKNGKLIYSDNNHLSQYGVNVVLEHAMAMFN
ncbi:acyltransferase family protein [Motilimonas pumila]|uniref:Acyltransferase n=1 Tax=Motilimonas pumila TaxID=2303987 RepID=A0A418YDV3_9GAMM|nr:acyltransferase family protein [Motilimonas pumila]RJG42709.1 acyltransferase [Motilimonas pumila]